jgi:hypothetical protein
MRGPEILTTENAEVAVCISAYKIPLSEVPF